MIVVDASALVAALSGNDESADWAADQMRSETLAAPTLAPFEAANVLRRLEAIGVLDRTAAALALDDLLALPIDLFPFDAIAPRDWELRHNTTIYDGAYLALAEMLDVPLVTLDSRLPRASGVTASVRTPSS